MLGARFPSDPRMKSKHLAALRSALDAFVVEVPTWGLAENEVRLGRHLQDAAAIDLGDKLADAGQVHRLTGFCPTVSVQTLWDFEPGVDPQAVLRLAASHGIRIGSVHPNLFDAEEFKGGSFAHRDPAVRQRAIDHCRESIRIGQELGSDLVSLWLADGTNYPGQDNLRERKRLLARSLQACHRLLSPRQTLLIEYQPFEPAMYATDIADWGMALFFSKQAGPKAKVLVDTGHHYPGQNVEQIVAHLLDEEMLGGFHFNDRRRAEDDLTFGSVDPYQAFRIFHEIHAFAADREACRGSLTCSINPAGRSRRSKPPSKRSWWPRNCTPRPPWWTMARSAWLRPSTMRSRRSWRSGRHFSPTSGPRSPTGAGSEASRPIPWPNTAGAATRPGWRPIGAAGGRTSVFHAEGAMLRAALLSRILRLHAAGLLAGLAAGGAEIPAAGETFSAPVSPRAVYNFNPGWRFAFGDAPGAARPEFDDSGWPPSAFRIPGMIRTPTALSSATVAAIKGRSVSASAGTSKRFRLPPGAEGQKVFLAFDGLRQAGHFFLNGQPIGKFENGVTAFGFDITRFARFGREENLLAVSVDNSPNYREEGTGVPFEWNTKDFNPNFGGLNRDARLIVTGRVYQTLPLTKGWAPPESIFTRGRSTSLGTPRKSPPKPRSATRRPTMPRSPYPPWWSMPRASSARRSPASRPIWSPERPRFSPLPARSPAPALGTSLTRIFIASTRSSRSTGRWPTSAGRGRGFARPPSGAAPARAGSG